MSEYEPLSNQELDRSSIQTRIEDWKARLIDLSRRNNLLYFRRTKRGSLSIQSPDAETIFNKLVLRKRKLTFWMPPEEQTIPSLRQQLDRENQSSSISENSQPKPNEIVSTLTLRKDLERTLANLNRRSRSNYRERGVRILHIAFGMLVWKEPGKSEEIHAPLVLVPIKLSRKSIRHPFSISIPPVEEEAILNPALQVKLKNELKIALPPLPDYWTSQSLTNYLDLIKNLAKDLGWRIELTVEIGLFSFHKLVIYKDLETNATTITQHPLIRAITGVKDTPLLIDSLPKEEDVDKIETPENTYQVLDADSSQRLCIDYAMLGQSYIMQGPPGTGKSQTITNIISECIARGKSVLFISDKMAALEVVYKRLSAVGLDRFCLELHSNKANKQELVAELKRCLDEELIQGKLPSLHDFEKMKGLREKLNDYVTLLHQLDPYLESSPYEILGKLASLEQTPFIRIGIERFGRITQRKMHELEELMIQLKSVWQVTEEPDFPWRGYLGTKFDKEVCTELSRTIDNIISAIDLLRSETTKFSESMGLKHPSSLRQTEWLIELACLLKENPKPGSQLITNPDLDRLIAEAENYQASSDWCQKTKNRLLEFYKPSFLYLNGEKIAKLEEILSAISEKLALNAKEASLSSLREDLLNFAIKTHLLTNKWKETCYRLSELLDVSKQPLTLERVRHFARLALLCFSEDKPPRSWFDPGQIEIVQTILKDAKQKHTQHSSIKTQLEKLYDQTFHTLDLDELIRRYRDQYSNFLRWFRPNFYRDQKKIAKTSLLRRVPETVLKDLKDARKLKVLSDDIEANSEIFKSTLGDFYKGYETNFALIEKTVEIALAAIQISGTSSVPEKLLQIASSKLESPAIIEKIGVELEESLNHWDQLFKNLVSALPSISLPNSELPANKMLIIDLQKWAEEIEVTLIALSKIMAKIVETFGSVEPQHYGQLIEDLKETKSVREKEIDFIRDKKRLQENFGIEIMDLYADWNAIISTIVWTKKLQQLFNSRPISPAFANAVSHGPSSTISSDDLSAHYETTLKFMDILESEFEKNLTYQNQWLHQLPIESILNRMKEYRDRIDELQVWIDYKNIEDCFLKMGIDAFFNSLIEQRIPAIKLMDVLRKAIYQEWINNHYAQNPQLGSFRRETHEQLINEFRKLDKELTQFSPNRIREKAKSRKPLDMLIKAEDSEVNTLMKEAAKKRRLLPIRNLMQKIPHLLFQLKPCLLMSPISVSQFLTPELQKFDIVLFDEASQIVPEEAVGCIYRGKTIVIAGDSRQLPPTSFFQKSIIEDYDWDEVEDDGVEVFDSILDESLGIGLPIKTLRWHYRSKHEELISFSNNHFYNSSLITFPAAKAVDENLGVKLVYLPDGVYDRGGKRDNQKEAEEVANLVFSHFQQHPNKTLGVVTFSIAQMEAVEEAIEKRLRGHPRLESFFKEDRLEGFFTKNLENVQGDERDVIIFSIGYGHDFKGKMTMNFGPLNKPGGERRLNVAVTRAREKIILVTSIRASDITTSSASPEGVVALKQYLDYAERGPETLKSTQPKQDEFESPLVEAVTKEIRKMGYCVLSKVGFSSYPIDIGVINPNNRGSFLLGVECDGATYHLSCSARDRDRLREETLNRLGWKIHRIWSPTWVDRHESEIKKLKEALK